MRQLHIHSNDWNKHHTLSSNPPNDIFFITGPFLLTDIPRRKPGEDATETVSSGGECGYGLKKETREEARQEWKQLIRMDHEMNNNAIHDVDRSPFASSWFRWNTCNSMGAFGMGNLRNWPKMVEQQSNRQPPKSCFVTRQMDTMLTRSGWFGNLPHWYGPIHASTIASCAIFKCHNVSVSYNRIMEANQPASDRVKVNPVFAAVGRPHSNR